MSHIYLYTGTGAGKTTNALGLALRSVGHGHRVVIVQFLKYMNTGEYKIRKKLKPYYEIYQFGREGWHGVDNLNERDKELVQDGIEVARERTSNATVNLLVLDEINFAVHYNLIDADVVIELLEHLPDCTNTILTGRYAPQEFIDMADFVNVIEDIKHTDEFVSEEGIQY